MCGTTLAGMFRDDLHGITLGTVDGDPGVELGMHLPIGSKAPWDHIAEGVPPYLECPPRACDSRCVAKFSPSGPHVYG